MKVTKTLQRKNSSKIADQDHQQLEFVNYLYLNPVLTVNEVLEIKISKKDTKDEESLRNVEETKVFEDDVLQTR